VLFADNDDIGADVSNESAEMTAQPDSPITGDWIQLQRDSETGIETVQAHFRGHAYDAHDHDEVLVGITLQGLQRFHCGRALHTSQPGRVILIEPGAVHDGHAPDKEGFTYAMLYLPQAWVTAALQVRNVGDISCIQPAFRQALTEDCQLGMAIRQAFMAMHYREGRLARDLGLERLICHLAGHVTFEATASRANSPQQILRVREFLHEQMARDVSLDELACYSGIDRFRLSRQFKLVFGLSPHAYLVRLRLRSARRLLAQGAAPALVALQVGFADQSHLGRWFQRAYRLSPANYRRLCTNVLD